MTYRYYMPTRVISGRDCIFYNKEIFKGLGKKAMLVTGANSAKKNGSEADVRTALAAVGVDCLVFDRVMSNPSVDCVYEGAAVARENNVDFIIALGGGSPMDAGKAIALLAVQDIKEEDLFSGAYGDKALPMVFVPTTAGTGSEVTQYSILTNDRARTKTSIATDLLFPEVAFLDSKYLEKLPVSVTVNTAVDALSHAVEGMLSVRASIISNALAKESIRTIMSCVPDMLEALESDAPQAIQPETRELLLQASLMAGMVIAQTGTTAVHAMGYSLTYFRDIDHGRANGLLLGEYLRLVEKERPELAVKILMAMGFGHQNQFKELMNRLLGQKEKVSSEEIISFSGAAIRTRNIANCIVKPSEEDIREMYRKSFLQASEL